MEGVTKIMLLILTVYLVAFVTNTEAGRIMKNMKEKVEQPQNFIGGVGGTGGIFNYPPFGTGFGFGPSTFCSFPGLGCIHSPPIASSKNTVESP
ncbi:hypothetical protein FRX31_011662 [Thalictrum thalictroides]|uniref:Transmembrane protein n=1 Tax=Thalictrum thalictroides TaxID=46969 RepID=A0A7J6WMZ4_THATH|nr:hypothetical protein FRX31_011662 [Thalictrum thalictroides]